MPFKLFIAFKLKHSIAIETYGFWVKSFDSKPSPFSSLSPSLNSQRLTETCMDLAKLSESETQSFFIADRLSESLTHMWTLFELPKCFKSSKHLLPSFTTYFKGVFLKSLRNDSLFCVKVFDSKKSCQKRSFLRFEIAKRSYKFSVSLALEFSVSRSFLKLSKKRNVLNVSDWKSILGLQIVPQTRSQTTA